MKLKIQTESGSIYFIEEGVKDGEKEFMVYRGSEKLGPLEGFHCQTVRVRDLSKNSHFMDLKDKGFIIYDAGDKNKNSGKISHLWIKETKWFIYSSWRQIF
tara:strand:+ start:359 stop:661 length:303 start_codon:yes stop_codon:yes gene_type:complete